MSDLHDRAFNLAVEKHGFHINDGNRDAVYAIVDLVSEQQQQTILDQQTLLDVADCPQCKDKSGAYYDNNGEVCQCQWCYEVKALAAQHIKNPIGESLAKEIHDQGR